MIVNVRAKVMFTSATHGMTALNAIIQRPFNLHAILISVLIKPSTLLAKHRKLAHPLMEQLSSSSQNQVWTLLFPNLVDLVPASGHFLAPRLLAGNALSPSYPFVGT